MKNWRSRLFVAVLIIEVWWLHGWCLADIENSPLGMLVFHGSAALCDFALIYSFPALVSGRLCDDMETLCLVSIIANFVGWLMYLAYIPPVFYNTFMWGLSYVQLIRLIFLGDDYASHFGGFVVRRSHSFRA